MTHPTGVLQGMDETDITLEAGWDGSEPYKLVSALVECGFLEKGENGAYRLHDWSDHQGYVIHAEQRKANARNAAAVRWKNREEQEMRNACSRHADSNPPSPLPSPVPSPIPVPEPVPVHSSPPAPATGNAERQRKKPEPAFAEDTEAYKLAVLMRDTLKANVPTLKEPNLQQWAQSFTVAFRNDERMTEPYFVAKVIKWTCSDSFWRSNIQSPDKLRQKFDQLTAKMENEAEKTRTASKAGTWASPAQRRVEANIAACEEAKRLLFGDTAPAEEALTYDAI